MRTVLLKQPSHANSQATSTPTDDKSKKALITDHYFDNFMKPEYHVLKYPQNAC